jgi:hypothetical protein
MRRIEIASGHTPPPEYIPPNWDGPHVGKRLVEGFRTLRLFPGPIWPREYGNAWPDYEYDWEDLLAQQQRVDEEKAAEARAWNWTPPRPSASDITLMETVIAWPGRYLMEEPRLLRVVGAAAVARAAHRDLGVVARRLGLQRRTVRARHNEGLERIARGLIRDRIRVW